MSIKRDREYWANLNEHTYSKKDFQLRISNLAYRIQSNCILLIQCRYEENPTYLQNINHWKTELRAHITECAKLGLSRKNNYDTRLKYICAEWLDGLELIENVSNITSEIQYINKKENTNIIWNREFQTILDTMIHRIIELIAEGDTEKISKWLDKL